MSMLRNVGCQCSCVISLIRSRAICYINLKFSLLLSAYEIKRNGNDRQLERPGELGETKGRMLLADLVGVEQLAVRLVDTCHV